MYLFTLTVTWWTLRGADPTLVRRLVVSQSTNLHNMTHQPLQVLVGSAFWLDDTDAFWFTVGQFLLVMAPAERWLGSRRWITAFVAGHVGASLVTVTGIAYAIHHGLLDNDIAHTADVGTSYGFYAVAALLTYRFTGRRQVAWAALLTGYLIAMACWRQTFTDYGHLTAAAIGFALRPLAPVRTDPSWYDTTPRR